MKGEIGLLLQIAAGGLKTVASAEAFTSVLAALGISAANLSAASLTFLAIGIGLLITAPIIGWNGGSFKNAATEIGFLKTGLEEAIAATENGGYVQIYAKDGFRDEIEVWSHSTTIQSHYDKVLSPINHGGEVLIAMMEELAVQTGRPIKKTNWGKSIWYYGPEIESPVNESNSAPLIGF